MCYKKGTTSSLFRLCMEARLGVDVGFRFALLSVKVGSGFTRYLQYITTVFEKIAIS